jgi:hypothetical protein
VAYSSRQSFALTRSTDHAAIAERQINAQQPRTDLSVCRPKSATKRRQGCAGFSDQSHGPAVCNHTRQRHHAASPCRLSSRVRVACACACAPFAKERHQLLAAQRTLTRPAPRPFPAQPRQKTTPHGTCSDERRPIECVKSGKVNGIPCARRVHLAACVFQLSMLGRVAPRDAGIRRLSFLMQSLQVYETTSKLQEVFKFGFSLCFGFSVAICMRPEVGGTSISAPHSSLTRQTNRSRSTHPLSRPELCAHTPVHVREHTPNRRTCDRDKTHACMQMQDELHLSAAESFAVGIHLWTSSEL